MAELIYDKPLFAKTIWGAITIISISIYGLINCSKKKEELKQITGQIEFILDKYMNLPNRDFGKYRFIKITTIEKPFEIFIGKESGDFKPQMEIVDRLKEGDTIVLFLNSIPVNNVDIVNRNVEVIEQNSKPYFIAANSKFLIFIICLTAGIGIAIWAMAFKSLGKII